MSLRGSVADEAIPVLQAGDCFATLAMTFPITYFLTTTILFNEQHEQYSPSKYADN